MNAAARTLRQVIPRAVPTFTRHTPISSEAAARASLVRDIELISSQNGTPLTLRELYAFGQRATISPTTTRITSAQWLHNELPIRLAHRTLELSELPHGLARMPSVITVRQMYEESFH